MIYDGRIRLSCFATLGLALGAGAANCFGDIETFWKTTTCPTFSGAKPPIAFEVGVMEAVVSANGVGGVFCRLLSTPPDATPMVSKSLTVNNAEVVVNAGDPPGPYAAGDQWNCVVCQYETKAGIVHPIVGDTTTDAVLVSYAPPGGGVPAVSFLGTVVLMAGLVVAAVYAIQRRKDVPAAN